MSTRAKPAWLAVIVRCCAMCCFFGPSLLHGRNAAADVLYGISTYGSIGQLDPTTGSWTAVKEAPNENSSLKQFSLAFYKSTFVAEYFLTPAGEGGNFLAFGMPSSDVCTVGPVPPGEHYIAGQWALRPVSNTLMLLDYSSGTTLGLWQYDLEARTLTVVPNSNVNLTSSCWTSSSQPPGLDFINRGIVFTDQNTLYGTKNCLTGPASDPNTQEYTRLFRWVYSSGAWSETLNIPIVSTTNLPIFIAGTGSYYGQNLAVDPTYSNTFYTAQNNASLTNTNIAKLVNNVTSATFSGLSTVSGVPGIRSLVYGPATSSIVSPYTVSGIKCADRSWVPLKMMGQ